MLTKDELVHAFTAGGQFALVDIAEGRFDPTPAYSSLEQGAPALLWATSFSARTVLVLRIQAGSRATLTAVWCVHCEVCL